MSDIRRIVTLSSTGVATTVVDLEQSGTIQSVRDSFKVTPPTRNPVLAKRQRRYGGARTVFETHDNGSIAMTLLVHGASAAACLANVSAVLSVTEKARTDLYFQWQPDGSTTPVYYEIRGPAKYEAAYRWVEFVGAQMLPVSVEIPVAPLARLAPQTFTISSTALPTVFSMTGIGGDAPALADVTLRSSSTPSSPPIWALLGWWKHPTGTPLASTVQPLGIIEAETGVGLSTWTTVGSDATFRNSNGLTTTTSGAGTAAAGWGIDPSLVEPDDFALGEIDVEVWARVKLASTLVSPRLTLSLQPYAGTNYGQPTYTPEYGSTGKLLTVPSSGTAFRMVRLGTLKLPVDSTQPIAWLIALVGSWATGSSGQFAVDYLMLVPARARACSKTGVANDAYYPDFITSTADTSKTIRSDLSGLTGSGTGNKGRDSGLGGSLIELPPGDVDMLLKLSSLVPDDPTSDTTSELLSITASGSVTVWPRVHLAK